MDTVNTPFGALNIVDQLILLWGIFQVMRLMSKLKAYVRHYRWSKGEIRFSWMWIVLAALLVAIPPSPKEFPVELTIAVLIGIPVFGILLGSLMTELTVGILDSQRIHTFSKRVVIPETVQFALVLASNVGTAVIAMLLFGYQWGPSIPIIWTIGFLVAWRNLSETGGLSLVIYHQFHDLLLYAACIAAILISPLVLGAYAILLVVDFMVAKHRFLP